MYTKDMLYALDTIPQYDSTPFDKATLNAVKFIAGFEIIEKTNSWVIAHDAAENKTDKKYLEKAWKEFMTIISYQDRYEN